MKHRNTVLTALILAVAACAGTDANKTGSDVTDLTAATYTVAPSAAVGVTPGASTVGVGQELKLTTKFVDEKGRKFVGNRIALIQWTSSDSTIAIVSNGGVVKGVSDGVVNITARYGNETAVSVVTVGTGHDSTTVTPAPVETTPAAPVPPVTEPAPTAPVAATPPPATLPPLTAPVSTAPTATVPPTATEPPPATEPVAATAPSSTSTASGAGLSGKAFRWDDYKGYRSTSDLQLMISRNLGGQGDPRTSLYSDGVNGAMASLDQDILYNGHATVRYNQPGGTSATPELWVSFPQPLRRFWFRAKVRFSTGYTTDGITPNYGKGYKLFGWGWQGNNGRGSVELGNTTQYYIVWGVTAGASASYGSSADVTATRHASAEWDTKGPQDGNWYDYIVLYEQTSSTTVRERWWLARDGEQPVLQGTNVGKMTVGEVPAANRFMLGMNFNQQRALNQNQALWYGQWELVDGEQNVNPFGLPGF